MIWKDIALLSVGAIIGILSVITVMLIIYAKYYPRQGEKI